MSRSHKPELRKDTVRPIRMPRNLNNRAMLLHKAARAANYTHLVGWQQTIRRGIDALEHDLKLHCHATGIDFERLLLLTAGKNPNKKPANNDGLGNIDDGSDL